MHRIHSEDTTGQRSSLSCTCDPEAMPAATAPHTRRSRRWSAAWGVAAAGVIAVFVFVPATFRIQHALDVPPISPVPAHLRAHPPEVAASYWWSWALSFALLLTPALVMAVFRRSRRAAVGYAITAAVLGGMLVAAVISFELGGFAPS